VWSRALVVMSLAFGCAAAGAQSYLVVSPARYTSGSVSAVTQGDGAQNTATDKDDLFNGTEIFAKGASDVTEITMDPDTLNLVVGPDEHKAHRMVLNVVRTYEYDKPGMYNVADVDRFREKLNTGDWHCSVHTRDLKTGSSTDVCQKHRTDGLKETAIISVEPKQLTFIHTIRKAGPGESELGFFPMVPGVSPMTMMAMNNPEAFAQMQMGIHGMPFVFDMNPDVVVKLQNLKIKPLEEEQLKKLNEQMNNLKIKPFDEKQMEELQKQMKNLQIMPPAPEAPSTPPQPE
jgi:hypothetical protein